MLEIKSTVSVQLLDHHPTEASSGSSILILASLPGQLNIKIDQQPKKQLHVQWKSPKNAPEELIFLHKSHCSNRGDCPITVFRLYILFNIHTVIDWACGQQPPTTAAPSLSDSSPQHGSP